MSNLVGNQLRFVNIEFTYHGPTDGSATDEKIDREFQQVERATELALVKAKVEFRHAYSWPDGSILKYVRTKLTAEDLIVLVNVELKKLGIKSRVHSVVDVDSSEKPWKYRHNGGGEFLTVQEYFDGTVEQHQKDVEYLLNPPTRYFLMMYDQYMRYHHATDPRNARAKMQHSMRSLVIDAPLSQIKVEELPQNQVEREALIKVRYAKWREEGNYTI